MDTFAVSEVIQNCIKLWVTACPIYDTSTAPIDGVPCILGGHVAAQITVCRHLLRDWVGLRIQHKSVAR